VAFSHTRHLILYTLDPTPLLTLGIAKSIYAGKGKGKKRGKKKRGDEEVEVDGRLTGVMMRSSNKKKKKKKKNSGREDDWMTISTKAHSRRLFIVF
jgi:hypothetical protein